MKSFLRKFLLVVLVVLVAALAYGGWWMFLEQRPPAPRLDLAHVPVDVAPPANGYPTLRSLYAGYLLGWVDAADINKDYPPPHGVRVEKDLEYARVGERALKLDVYYPEAIDGHATPILVFIHGGGWSGGDKRDYAIYCNKFAELGYVVATVGYRFSKEAKFPAAVQDVNAAVRWLKANASRFGGDRSRVATIGGSAGGYLAMMTGYAPDVAEFQLSDAAPGETSQVQAVVDLYGPTDLTAEKAQTAPQVTRFLDADYATSPELFAKASPMEHLDANDPPTLIIQGMLDDVVPPEQSDALAEKLRSLGVDYWYDPIEGWPHTLDIVWANFDHTSALIHEFLKAQGLGAAPIP